MLKTLKMFTISALTLFCWQVKAQKIEHISTHFTSIFDEGASEIVVYDKDNKRLIFTNAKANSITLLDFSDPKNPSEIKSVSLENYGGGINSVAYHNNLVVAAVEDTVKQAAGSLVFFDKDGNYLAAVKVGALPDMVTFSKDGKYVLAACEGEPNDDYTIDPVGSIAIVDLSNFPSVTSKLLDFSAYNDQVEYLKNKGIRIFGPNASVAQDMEPEYITCANDSLAYVSCQENNVIAVVDFKNAKILDVYSAGVTDHSVNGGSIRVEEYHLNEQSNWPKLGKPAYGVNAPTVNLGGFSGLFYDSLKSSGGKHIFYAIPDRGPNGDAVAKATVTPKPAQNLRPFKLPDYQSRIVKIVYDEATKQATVDSSEQILLYAPNGTTPISGKGNIPGVDEVPVTYTDANSQWNTVDYKDANGIEYTVLPYDPLGGDFEGILRDKNGDFWMCDEYRPAVYKFAENGVMKDRFIPSRSEIFFSEYAEGSSNNKYIEIFNPSNVEVDLSDYMLVSCSNGCSNEGEFETDNSGLISGRKLGPGEVFIFAQPNAQANILKYADTVHTLMPNGNDWWAILRAGDSSLVDQIGASSATDPGKGWDVAGQTNATLDHTLVRKPGITNGSTDWASSAGIDSASSEWFVFDGPEADTVMPSIGSHNVEPRTFFGTESLPSVYNLRWANRGFEAIAYDYDQDIIYTFIQSPLYNPSSITKDNSDVIRILGMDLNGKPVAEYVYLLERNRLAGYTDGRLDKMGDAVYMGNGKFRLLERDSGIPGDDESKKYVVEISLVGATNILGTAISTTGTKGLKLEQMTGDEMMALGVQPVKRRVVTNLPSIGYLPSDKAEGLAWMAPNKMAVINDNDFGLAGAGVSDVTSLGIIYFMGDHKLDVSDKDDAINLDNYPVLGLRMPDALTSISQGGKTYILTANEGDSRDYDGFSEEERVGDLTLDSMAYPNFKDLQEKEALGRLKTTSTLGDYDGDGDYDQIYAYGSRSFTIYDQYGNVIFDSGDDFERIMAEKYPDEFNSTNDENQSFDNRSDDKGPEPEAISTGVWKDSVYAFIGLERMGGVMVYNITNVRKPHFVAYFNHRDFAVTDVKDNKVGDLGPECVLFLDSTVTPDGKYYIVTANEVSGSVSVFEWGDFTVGTPEVEAKMAFTVYPNPADGNTLNLSIQDNYTVYDLAGRSVIKTMQSQQIDISNLEKGTYILRNGEGASRLFVRQ